jgi:hypothetical protein
MEIKMKKIEEIINEWDPIGLFPLAPKDEYKFEIEEIYNYLMKHNHPEEDELAAYIKMVFTKSFDADIFDNPLEECVKIAGKIINK